MLLTWPRPTPEQLAELYDEQYYDDHGMGSVASKHWQERAAEILRFIATPAATVLDCGAGQGHFVAALGGLGLSATGVEPSASARTQAAQQHGVELLAELPAGGSWDLITFVHSLEHVPDPLAYLRRVVDLLRPGGCLYIEVPHAGSVEMWRPRWRRRILTLPAHLYHFTPESLERLAREAGLEVSKLRVADAELLVWLYEHWTRWRRRPSAPEQRAQVSSGTQPAESPGPVRSTAKRRLIAAATRLLPGWKFQVVARVREDAVGAGALRG